VSSGYNQAITAAGNSNLFISEFSPAGSLIWSSYYGANDGASRSSISSNGVNVFVTGTISATDFPVQSLAGAYNQAVNNEAAPTPASAFILQFHCATNARIWATYYGGSATIGSSIQCDNRNVWITGSTMYGIPAPSGVIIPGAIFFGLRAFVAQFNEATDSMVWVTTYGGSSGNDYGNSIYSDGVNVWVTGSTSSIDFPVLNPGGNAFFQSNLMGTTDAFILQFTNAGVLTWATYYGGAGTAAGTSIVGSEGIATGGGWGGGFVNGGIKVTGYFTSTIGGLNSGVSTSDPFTLSFNYSIGLTVSIPELTVCSGHCGEAVATVSGGSGSYNYQWSNGSTGSTVSICPTQDTSYYTVTVTDGLSMGSTAAIATVIIGKCNVWPGDADENGIANNYDMLALGLGYGNTGPARSGASINWVGQAAGNWTNSLPGLGTNDKFADCNGDGKIDFNDTTAIVQNYGLTHSLRLKQPNNVSGLPELYFTFPSDTIMAGSSIQVPVGLGTNNNPMNGVYGIAFSINYDANMVDTSKLSFSLTSSWIGQNGTNLLYITKNYGLEGQLDVGITRIDHKAISGSGTIGVLNITMKDDILLRMKTHYYLLNLFATQIKAINNNDSVLEVNGVPVSIVVSQVSTGINSLNISSGIKLYPNPASGSFTIDLSQNQVKEMDLFNVIGEKIWQQYTGFNDRMTIDTQNLAAGTYYLSVLTNQGKIVKQVNVIR